MALRSCPECAAQMADSASKCPSCGWANRGVRDKVLVLILGLVLATGALVYVAT